MFKLKLVLLISCTMNCVLQTDAKIVISYVCPSNITDIATRKPIENLKEYCKDLGKPCVPKCCGQNEVLTRRKVKGKWQWPICTSTITLGIGEPNYAELEIYQSLNGLGVTKTDKHLLGDFHLVQNRMFKNESCMERWNRFTPYLLENGMFTSDLTSIGASWIQKAPEYYCMDLAYAKSKNATIVTFYVAKEIGKNIEKELIFVGVASLISSAFLIPVLVVYSVLPQLRNLSGMLLMAYVATLFVTFMIKAILIFFSSHMTCAVITTVFYFACLSTFFWLNIMSFDIWWTFRGQRLKRAINRRGELVKFGWYSLYGWGAPLGLTIIAAIIDKKRDELPANIVKPMFDTCLNSEISVQYYVNAPTGLLTIINIVLFMMTVYNIWLIKKKLSEFNSSSSSTKKNQNRFGLYVKISMLMGASWLLELMVLLYDEMPFWAYVLMNMYNALIGVVIFVMFILNKKILRYLCIRYNIQCRFVETKKFDPNNSTTKSSTNNGSYHRPATDDSDVEMYDVDVNTNPNPKSQQ